MSYEQQSETAPRTLKVSLKQKDHLGIYVCGTRAVLPFVWEQINRLDVSNRRQIWHHLSSIKAVQHWNVVRVTEVTGGKLGIREFFWFCSLRKSEISIGELVHDLHYSAARGHNIWTFCVDINAAKHYLSSSVIIQPGSPGASIPPSIAL